MRSQLRIRGAHLEVAGVRHRLDRGRIALVAGGKVYAGARDGSFWVLLDPLVVRQLERVLLNAAESPGTIPEVVAARIEAEGRQSSTLDSFSFCLERTGDRCVRPVTANEIDDILGGSRDLEDRLRAWNASKETGPALEEGLRELQRVRNEVAREMGYASFFDLQVADYGMTADEMTAMLERWLEEIRPLYEQLHCYTKHELAARYGNPVPRRIPAHWLNNRWAQNWDGIVEGVDLASTSRPRLLRCSWYLHRHYRSISFCEGSRFSNDQT